MFARSLLVFLLAILLIPALPAQAKAIRLETHKSSTPNGKPAAALVINGEIVLQLAKDQRGREPLRNVSVVAARLAEAFRTGQFKLEAVASDSQERNYNLLLNGTVLVVATDQEGKAWGADPAALAQTWLKNIEQAVVNELAAGGPQLSPELPKADPPATVDNAAADVQLAFGHATIDAPPEDKPSPATGGGSGIIDYSSAGTRNHPDYAGLIVSSGNVVYQPPSSTQVSGNELPSAGTVRVTGKRPSATLIERAVDNALRLQAGVGPEAKLSWQKLDKDSPLEAPAGTNKTLEVKYSAAGRPETSAQLKLENRALASPRESLTFFSNRPERVDREQLLYYAELPGRQAGRLVYHHQLASQSDLRFVARVINSSDQPSAIYIVPGDAPPDVNTFYVGYVSAETFWKNLNAGNGYVASLPPGGQAVLIEHRLTGGQTGSGYYKLVNLSDNPLLVETLTLKPGTPIPNRAIRDRDGASSTVYGPPYYAISEVYTCGDPWKYLRLGENDPASLTGGPALDGCYGMTHSYSVELRNERDRPALVFVVLRASAGEVKGQFYIDDEYVGTPLVKAGDERLLKEIPLKAGETKLLKLNAMPLNGGFYPASIILRESRYP